MFLLKVAKSNQLDIRMAKGLNILGRAHFEVERVGIIADGKPNLKLTKNFLNT